MNTFGHCFRVTTFGESHGEAIGAVVDGCPPRVALTAQDIQKELDRRRPGQSDVSTPRKELDTCEILSGVFEGKTLGTPIAVVVRNTDQISKDYEDIKEVFRPSHADFGYEARFGIRDYRGGGRASARETIGRVIGGAIAKKVLKEFFGIQIWGFVDQIGEKVIPFKQREVIEENPLRIADASAFDAVYEMVKGLKAEGDSIGSGVQIRVEGLMPGIGAPVFGKLEAVLSQAIMSVPAVKGIAFGDGFALIPQKGSQANDPFEVDDTGRVKTRFNRNGGILGGISTGDTLWFRVAIKPTSSILKPQKTIDKRGKPVNIRIKGRHDPILGPRAVPILEAMTALVLLDQIMLTAAQTRLKEAFL